MGLFFAVGLIPTIAIKLTVFAARTYVKSR